MCIIKDDVISVRVDSRLGKEGIWRKHSNSLFFFLLIFLFVTSCTFIFDSFNVSFNRANFQHCRVFNFSFFSFPVRANTRLFRQCVYAGVFVRKRVTVQTMCASVDWLIRLFRNFFICFCSLTIIIIIMILFPFFEKKAIKPNERTLQFFFVCFPPFRYVDNIDFWFSYFFPLSPTLQMSRKKHNTTKKDKNKTYYITNDIGDIITSIPRHLTNKKREHKLYTSSHIRTKRNTLSINPYVIIKTTWSCLLHSTFWGVMDSLSFFFVANPQEENICWIKTVAAVAATWRWKIYFVCSRHRKRYLLLFSSHEKKKKKRENTIFSKCSNGDTGWPVKTMGNDSQLLYSAHCTSNWSARSEMACPNRMQWWSTFE